MTLTASQQILLRAIAEQHGAWNWYQLGRAYLTKLEDPSDFELEPLVREGYIEETQVLPGEKLPRLLITEKGLSALQS